MLDKHPVQRILSRTMAGLEQADEPTGPSAGDEGPLRPSWRGLRVPDGLSSPIMLRARGAYLLFLLALANLGVLALLGLALRQAMSLLDVPVPVRSEVVLVPLVEASPAPTSTATPSRDRGAIAFTLRRDGTSDIYAFDRNTEQVIRLTHDSAEDRSPTWSPDGDHIAFASNRNDNWDIYLMDLLSGALIRLTHDPGFDANPSWSPDGEWIAFESYRDGTLDIYVMSTTGEQLRRLTDHPAPDYGPAWTPDSEAIVFTSLRDGSKDICMRSLHEGAAVVNLTQSPSVFEDTPAWSPDGMRLAFVSGPQGHTSVQVAYLRQDALWVDQSQTEFVGMGSAPGWDLQTGALVYVYERDGRSHILATSVTGRARFEEIYSVKGSVSEVAVSGSPISPQIIARAEQDLPDVNHGVDANSTSPAPRGGALVLLDPLPGVSTREGSSRLSARVSHSFTLLREHTEAAAGWDYLGRLGSCLVPINHVPAAGQSRKSWQVCGRGFSLDEAPYWRDEHTVQLVREDVADATYWRVFIRAARQDGSMGEPLRVQPWDLKARQTGGLAAVDGGVLQQQPPPGYYVDFTALAGEYGWHRVASSWRWRHFTADVRWAEYQHTGDLSWWDCMLEVFEPEEVEAAFGPIPGRGD